MQTRDGRGAQHITRHQVARISPDIARGRVSPPPQAPPVTAASMVRLAPLPARKMGISENDNDDDDDDDEFSGRGAGGQDEEEEEEEEEEERQQNEDVQDVGRGGSARGEAGPVTHRARTLSWRGAAGQEEEQEQEDEEEEQQDEARPVTHRARTSQFKGVGFDKTRIHLASGNWKATCKAGAYTRSLLSST